MPYAKPYPLSVPLIQLSVYQLPNVQLTQKVNNNVKVVHFIIILGNAGSV